MNHAVLRLCLLVSSIVSFIATVGELCSADSVKDKWLHDFASAREAAVEGDKDLLIVFTGRGWCQPCEIFDRRVAGKPEFFDGISDKFICVELDMSFGESETEKNREVSFRQLQKEYLADILPTLILADSTGKPYCYIVGPSSTGGPQPLLDEIFSAKAAHLQSSQQILNAEKLTGANRGNALHEALQCIAPYLPLQSDGSDPLFKFYALEISEIGELLPAGSAANKFYRDRIRNRDSMHRLQEVYSKIREFRKGQNNEDAIAYIDAALVDEVDESLRWYLETAKLSFLSNAGKHQEVLANVHRLLARKSIEDSRRLALYRIELDSLTELGELDDAVVRLDGHILSVAENAHLKSKLLYEKARWFDRQNLHAEASSAWYVYRAQTQPNSFDRLTGSAYLARSLQKEGKHHEAIELFEEILMALQLSERGEADIDWPWSYKRRGFTLIEISESEIAIGNWEAALDRLSEADANAQELEVSSSNSDREDAERMRTRIRELRSNCQKN